VEKAIQETIQLGDPVEHRGVVIAPLFPRQRPRARYLTLEEAIPLGFRVSEVNAAGSVPELLVTNPLDHDVLLYDGEELIGAKQNRILNVTVLVPAESDIRIPVSCVEEGRWHSRSAVFAAAPHTAYPELRRRKAVALSAEPLERGVAQQVVWDAVREKAAVHGIDSPTGAQADVFRSQSKELGALRSAFALLQPGQSGALFALGDGLTLDYVSQPEAFARLYPKLLDGYLLDALERLDRKPASESRLEEFIEALGTAPRSSRPSAGRGEDVRVARDGVVGSGLELDSELIQLSVFSSPNREKAHTRIARPSRRE
jgi:ARG and Rhodanese-Phosphatase-superfamily-associated Protein domain